LADAHIQHPQATGSSRVGQTFRRTIITRVFRLMIASPTEDGAAYLSPVTSYLNCRATQVFSFFRRPEMSMIFGATHTGRLASTDDICIAERTPRCSFQSNRNLIWNQYLLGFLASQ